MTAVGTPQNDEGKSAPSTLLENRSKARMTLIRPAVDALSAFAVFAFVVLAWTCAPSSASPNVPHSAAYQRMAAPEGLGVTQGEKSAALTAVAAKSTFGGPAEATQTSERQISWGLLAIAFSILAALNLAVLRHLRQAYAMPRRRNS
jgi:hypothetical protein